MEGLGRLLRADLRLKERKYELPGKEKGNGVNKDY